VIFVGTSGVETAVKLMVDERELGEEGRLEGGKERRCSFRRLENMKEARQEKLVSPIGSKWTEGAKTGPTEILGFGKKEGRCCSRLTREGRERFDLARGVVR